MELVSILGVAEQVDIVIALQSSMLFIKWVCSCGDIRKWCLILAVEMGQVALASLQLLLCLNQRLTFLVCDQSC